MDAPGDVCECGTVGGLVEILEIDCMVGVKVVVLAEEVRDERRILDVVKVDGG